MLRLGMISTGSCVEVGSLALTQYTARPCFVGASRSSGSVQRREAQPRRSVSKSVSPCLRDVRALASSLIASTMRLAPRAISQILWESSSAIDPGKQRTSIQNALKLAVSAAAFPIMTSLVRSGVYMASSLLHNVSSGSLSSRMVLYVRNCSRV